MNILIFYTTCSSFMCLLPVALMHIWFFHRHYKYHRFQNIFLPCLTRPHLIFHSLRILAILVLFLVDMQRLVGSTWQDSAMDHHAIRRYIYLWVWCVTQAQWVWSIWIILMWTSVLCYISQYHIWFNILNNILYLEIIKLSKLIFWIVE